MANFTIRVTPAEELFNVTQRHVVNQFAFSAEEVTPHPVPPCGPPAQNLGPRPSPLGEGLNFYGLPSPRGEGVRQLTDR